MDIVGIVLVAIAALVVLDLVVAGGAVTVTCAGALVGVMAHPATWLVILIVAVILFAGIGALAWG
jgi:hypothetical protein